jgi:hypothetical protein
MKLPLFFIIGELNGVDNVVEYAIMVKSSLKSNQVSPFLFTKLSCTMFDHTAAKYRFHGIDILGHILFFCFLENDFCPVSVNFASPLGRSTKSRTIVV